MNSRSKSCKKRLNQRTNDQRTHNSQQTFYCCEVGCNIILPYNSIIVCNICRKPMCQTCKDKSLKINNAFGKCNYCCWDEIS